MVRQFRGYRNHLDLQAFRGKQTKTRVKKKRKLCFDSNNNGRKEDLLTAVSPSVQASLPILYEALLSSRYINKMKLHKKN